MENIKWPPTRLGAFLFVLFCFSGCSVVNGLFISKPNKSNETFSNSDYIAQINYQGNLFLKQNKNKIVRLKRSEKEYYEGLIEKIISDNLKYLEGTEINYELILLSTKTPFYFVLPNGKMFVSLGLIKKYLDNENLLTVVLAKMIFISKNSVYVKRVSVPRGFISLIEMMKIVDLPLEIRSEVNKWTYHMLYRSGFDGSAVLNWIQIQNKNILDFSMMHKDLNLISKEEYNFKNFIIKNENRKTIKLEKNSSAEFYRFKKGLVKNATVNTI